MSGDIFDSHNLGDATGIRAEARMRRLDPGQNPMCDLTIGNYKVCLAGFMGQSCPPHIVFQVSYSHRLRPPWAGMLLCISAFLAQEPPGASLSGVFGWDTFQLSLLKLPYGGGGMGEALTKTLFFTVFSTPSFPPFSCSQSPRFTKWQELFVRWSLAVRQFFPSVLHVIWLTLSHCHSRRENGAVRSQHYIFFRFLLM